MHTHHILTVSPGSLLEPALDGTLQRRHEPAIDGLNSDDRGNNNTKEVNMQVRRCLQNSWNVVHELTCATMRMLSIECCGNDALPVNDHDADVGEESVRAQRRTMNDAKFYSKHVWTVIDLAHTLQLESQKVTMDCLAWNEGDFKEKQRYMADRMSTIQGMTIRIMNLGSEILKHINTANDKATYMHECVWRVVDLCRMLMQEVERVRWHSVGW